MIVPGASSPASVDPYLSNLKGALIKMNGFKKEWERREKRRGKIGWLFRLGDISLGKRKNSLQMPKEERDADSSPKYMKNQEVAPATLQRKAIREEDHFFASKQERWLDPQRHMSSEMSAVNDSHTSPNLWELNKLDKIESRFERRHWKDQCKDFKYFFHVPRNDVSHSLSGQWEIWGIENQTKGTKGTTRKDW